MVTVTGTVIGIVGYYGFVRGYPLGPELMERLQALAWKSCTIATGPQFISRISTALGQATARKRSISSGPSGYPRTKP